MDAHPSDRDGRRALDWAFLFWGRSGGQARREVWPLYFAGETARREEARLFTLMRADETLQEFTRVSAEKAVYDRDVIDLRPRPLGSDPRLLDAQKLDKWAVLTQRRDALARALLEIHRPSA